MLSRSPEEAKLQMCERIRRLPVRGAEQLINAYEQLWLGTRAEFCEGYMCNYGNFKLWILGDRESPASAKAVKQYLQDLARTYELPHTQSLKEVGIEELWESVGGDSNVDAQPRIINQLIGEMTTEELQAAFIRLWPSGLDSFTKKYGGNSNHLSKWLNGTRRGMTGCRLVSAYLHDLNNEFTENVHNLNKERNSAEDVQDETASFASTFTHWSSVAGEVAKRQESLKLVVFIDADNGCGAIRLLARAIRRATNRSANYIINPAAPRLASMHTFILKEADVHVIGVFHHRLKELDNFVYSAERFGARRWLTLLHADTTCKDAVDMKLAMVFALLDVNVDSKVRFLIVSHDEAMCELAASCKRYVSISKHPEDIWEHLNFVI